MNPTHPNNLIIHNDPHRILVPWNWLLRLRADNSNSTVELVFSGLRVVVTTTEPAELLEAINNGKVRRLRVAPVKTPAETDFVVTNVTVHDEDDDDE
jgi:hypothetical protein